MDRFLRLVARDASGSDLEASARRLAEHTRTTEEVSFTVPGQLEVQQ